MKKIFILLFVLFVGFTRAQSPVFQENFGTLTAIPAGWQVTSDWGTDNLVTCTVVGSSGNSHLYASDAGASLQSAITPSFSTVGFSNMTITWNGYHGSAFTSTVSFWISPDGTTWTNIPFTDVAQDDAWHPLPSLISIPPAFNGLPSVYLKWEYTGVNTAEFVLFDDIDMQGSSGSLYFWNGLGAITSTGSWGVNANGSGANPADFTSAGQTFNLVNAASATLSGPWVIGGASSKLNIGDGITAINFNVNGALSFTNGAQMNVLNNSSLTLQNTTLPASSDVVLFTGSTVDFAQNSSAMWGGLTFHNLTISGASGKTHNGNTIVNGVLNLNGANLTLANSAVQKLTLNGSITGSGSFNTLGTSANLAIGGSGAFGTITFIGTKRLCQFNLNRSAGSIVLGSDLTITPVAIPATASLTALPAGDIDLNSFKLTFNGATTFGSGSFKGSITSGLIIGSNANAFNGTLMMDQTSSTTKALGELTLNRASSNLTLGNPIEIWGAVTPSVGTITTGGNLTVKQDATNKGRIGTISTGGFSGNVTVETFILGGQTGWALLGASGISGQTMNDWYGQFPMAIEGSATGVTSAGGYFESVQGWNESDSYGYDTTITVSTPLGAGKGYWTYLGTGPSTTSDITLVLTGTPITGNVNIPLTNSAQSGTCLIANPYASPISWTALRNGNIIVANSIHIYNADGAYASFVGGIGANGGSDIIPAGQGFFVQAVSATNLTAQESNKVSSNIDLMKTSSSSVNVGLPIRLKLNGFSADHDETVVRFHGSASNAYDLEWDARKIFQTPGYVGYPGGYSKYTTISTKGGSLDYSINSLPFALTQNAVIPVLVKVMTSGQYTITGQDMQLLPPNACVTLKDKLLNVTHNIKATPYVFTMNDTTSTARFELTVCADITTGVNENSSSLTSIDQSVLISQNASGVNVNLNFDKTTKAKISVTNVLGQKIVENKIVNTQNESVFFGLEAKNQLLFISVETENNKVTKKVIH
jgi:hypothetical protein